MYKLQWNGDPVEIVSKIFVNFFSSPFNIPTDTFLKPAEGGARAKEAF